MRAVNGQVVQRTRIAHRAGLDIDVCNKAAAAAVIDGARPRCSDALHGKAQLKFLGFGIAQNYHTQGVCAVRVNFVEVFRLVRIGANEPLGIAAQTVGKLLFRVRLVVADDAVTVVFDNVHALALAGTHRLYDIRSDLVQKLDKIVIIVYDSAV